MADNIIVVDQTDNIVVIDPTDNILVTLDESPAIVQPRVAEVQVQIIEDLSVPYAKRTEFVGEDKIYKGRAIPGSLSSDPVWQVWLVTITDTDEGDNNETWADGDASFDNIWDDYLTLVYS